MLVAYNKKIQRIRCAAYYRQCHTSAECKMKYLAFEIRFSYHFHTWVDCNDCSNLLVSLVMFENYWLICIENFVLKTSNNVKINDDTAKTEQELKLISCLN